MTTFLQGPDQPMPFVLGGIVFIIGVYVVLFSLVLDYDPGIKAGFNIMMAGLLLMSGTLLLAIFIGLLN